MIEVGELARWTPVALNLDGPAPSIDWCDLTGERFAEPFFDQTVERALAGTPPRRLVRTGLDVLLSLDTAPSLEPAGLIFHLSRCGSTLVSRLLATIPGVLVAAEPAPLNALLEADPARVHEDVQVQVLRLLVRAIGRIRFGDERHYVVKLSSWNVRRLALFRRAFPDVPALWVQRRPDEVLASLLAGPPGWLRLKDVPRGAEHLFGIPPEETASLDILGFCTRALGALLEAASGLDATVDYRMLPEACWTRIAPYFGIAVTTAEVARMQAEAQYSAKQPGRVAFAPPPSAAPAERVTAAAAALAAAYAALAGRQVPDAVVPASTGG